jgi:NADH-quinone oxidoreductase subunit L
MFEIQNVLWLIPGLPLLGAIGCILLGSRKKISHVPCVIGAVGAFAITLFALIAAPGDSPAFSTNPVTWFHVGPLNVDAKLTVDPLSAIMLLAITFIGSWIVVFSIGYMHNDPGYSRYFACVSLFLFSMTLLVLGDNLLMLFAGWEGVGLCSYLLIGYWYAKPSAAQAARKAFLVTRLGDVGLILGIFVLWSNSGHKLDFESIFNNANYWSQRNPETLSLACLLLFCGAVGKSAQFPLYVWLPDAMEGPTPVSALIHAATMVTAGVYLLARCMPLFALAPGVQITVAAIGAFTALLAAFIALTQHDLKRVLAYSTVSQLGYMFLALGCGGKVAATVAVTAAIFHLFTHAFFKAVLFLSAGSVMHAMGDVIDMRKFGGLRKVLPITHATFLCGAAALAGLPLLSGFWSKDQILEVTQQAASGGAYAIPYVLLFIVAIVTAFMTAFYTFRAYFLTFWGETRIPAEAGDHAHESPSVMTVPLIVLALGALLVGIIAEPFTHWFSDFIGQTTSLARANGDRQIEHHLDWLLMIGSTVVAVGGAGLAYWMYHLKLGVAEVIPRKAPAWYYASLNKLYVDEIFNLLFVQPMNALAAICKGLEGLVFDIVRLIAAIPRGVAELIRPLQNGLVQFYALTMAMGLVAFIGYLILWAGR